MARKKGSNMNIKEIKATLEADKERALKFEEALHSIKKEDVKSEAEAFSLAAAAVGLEITPEEVERELAAAMELNDDELEAINVGVDTSGEDPIGHDNSCTFLWHCYATTWHNEEYNDNTKCWSDHICWGSYMKNNACSRSYEREIDCTLTWEHRYSCVLFEQKYFDR